MVAGLRARSAAGPALGADLAEQRHRAV